MVTKPMMLGSIAVYHLMVYFMTSVTGGPIIAQALSHWNNDHGENLKGCITLSYLDG